MLSSCIKTIEQWSLDGPVTNSYYCTSHRNNETLRHYTTVQYSTRTNLLSIWHWEIPPCSPDLAPSDLHLFPKMKKHLQSLHFQIDKDVKVQVKQWQCLQEAQFCHQGFEALIYRYDMCLNRYGDYVQNQTLYVPIPVLLTVTCLNSKQKPGNLTFRLTLTTAYHGQLSSAGIQTLITASTKAWKWTLSRTSHISP
jgi:hypothetical protein